MNLATQLNSQPNTSNVVQYEYIKHMFLYAYTLIFSLICLAVGE